MKKFSLLSLMLVFCLIINVAHATGTKDAVTTFTDAQKSGFVTAYAEVEKIQNKYRSKFSPEMSNEDQQKMADEANAEMKKAIDKVPNMDADTYSQMIMAMKTDQKLLNEIQGSLGGAQQ